MLDLEKLVESAGDAIVAANLRVPATHKDGRRLSIAFTVTLLPGAIVAFMRDETARWNEERTLRERIKELEAKGS